MTGRFATCVLLSATVLMASTAFASAFDSPEAAVSAYVEAVATLDFDAVLDATAVEDMGKAFDFVAYVHRLRAMTPTMPAPTGSDFFEQVNAVQFTATVAAQVKFLAIALLTTSTVVDGMTVMAPDNEAEIFAEQFDPARLGDLKLEKVAIPSPDLVSSERYLKNAAQQAGAYGADELTERAALVAFEGKHYVLGFTLARYGDDWGVMSQTSPIMGVSALGVPVIATPEEFEDLTN